MRQTEGKDTQNIICQVLLALLGTYGICWLGNAAGLDKASFSVMGVPLAAGLLLLIRWTWKRMEGERGEKSCRRRIRYAAVVSFLFSVSMITGYQLQTFGMTESGFLGKGLILFRGACLSIALLPFGILLFQGIEKLGSWTDESSSETCPETSSEPSAAVSPAGASKPCASASPTGSSKVCPGASPLNSAQTTWKKGKVYGISALLIFLCLIPVWLAYYPIIMSYDFHRQINEAYKGFAWFWPYQPLAHTWVIWLFLQLGNLLGNIQTGMACMALLQMLLYSLAAAWAVLFLYRVTARKWTAAAAVMFFGVFPLNSVMVVCTTKDVLFTILFLVFVLLLAERFFFSGGKKQQVLDLLLLAEGCLMMQFRNNCIYAIAVFGVFWFIFSAKKEKLRVLLLCVLLVAGGKGMAAGIKAALGTELESAKVEMYSVPIQQFARVGYYHGEELDSETRQMLNSYVLEDDWKKYNPPIADTVKASVGVTTFHSNWEGHMGQFLKDWLHLGLRYPNEYIDAFLELTRGYWFWDDRSYAECLGYGAEGRMGIIYTYNSSAIENGPEILHESKFPWLEERLEDIVSANAYYDWPLISLFFKCAFYVWGLFLLITAFLYLKRKKQAVFCLFPALYMATMLLGPVVQIRYIFPLMVTLPVLAGLLKKCRVS